MSIEEIIEFYLNHFNILEEEWNARCNEMGSAEKDIVSTTLFTEDVAIKALKACKTMIDKIENSELTLEEVKELVKDVKPVEPTFE